MQTLFRILLAEVSLVFIASGLIRVVPVQAQERSSDGPRYNAARELIRPADYREWVYVTSGLGMTYGPAGGNGAPAMFDNVFVNRDSYRAFLKTGRWPDKTMFML